MYEFFLVTPKMENAIGLVIFTVRHLVAAYTNKYTKLKINNIFRTREQHKIRISNNK